MIPETLLEWMRDHQALLWYGAAVSVVVFIASLLVLPPIIVRIRPDYFTHAVRPPSTWSNQHPLVRGLIVIGKNLLGVILMIMGVAMLVLPGQGLLTLLAGFLLIDFPGKYRLEKSLIRRRWIIRPINWLRRRRGRSPLLVETGRRAPE